MDTKKLLQSKTVRLCLGAILAAWAAYFSDAMTVKEAVIATVTALGGIFLRQGAAVPITKALLLAVLAVGLTACGSVPVSAQGAQNLTGQQGQAAETGSAYVQFEPHINAFLGYDTITIHPDGTVTAEGGGDNLAIQGDLKLGAIEFGDESLNPGVSSGGGSQAGTRTDTGGGN